jgi:hypothetical protein
MKKQAPGGDDRKEPSYCNAAGGKPSRAGCGGKELWLQRPPA